MRILLLILLFNGICFASNGNSFVPGEIIITYKIGTSIEDQKKLEEKYSLKVIRKFRLTNSIFYKIQSELDPPALKNKVLKYDFVEIVTLNHLLTPNALNFDSDFSNQWYMENTGQEIQFDTGVAGIDIGWKQAMAIYSKKVNSYVAVLDSGFAEDHDEIKDKNAINSTEFFGEVGKDDDKNGYTDDIYGWDFFSGDPNPYDFNGHGTKISSLVSGANDGIGMQGIAPDAYVIPLRVAGEWFDGITRPTLAAVNEALEYVYYKPEIRVLNLSLSLGKGDLLAKTLDKFDQDNRVLVVCSASNGGVDKIGDDNDIAQIMPASLGNDCIISVASIDHKGNLSKFSNYGKTSVDLAAPGEDIFMATIKDKLKEFYPIIPSYWSQTFGWTESPLSWIQGSLYQESFWYKSPTFISPYTTVPFLTELSNYLDSIDISQAIQPKIVLNLNYQIVGDGSYAYLYSSDKELGPYTLKYTFRGYTGQLPLKRLLISFDEYAGSDKLFLKIIFLKNGPYDYFNLGTLELWDLDVDDYQGTPKYEFDSGTSFSAPVVSAVASMLFSHRPDLLASDVKKIILDSVQPLGSLTGKVLSGGMVRADYALAEANNYRQRVKLDINASSWFEDLLVSSEGVVTENNNYGTSEVGRLVGSSWYFKGDTVTFEAIANDGWEFIGWGNSQFTNESKQTLHINEDIYLTALYSPDLKDEDNDSLEYYYEIAWGTDPNNSDSDGDSISDGDEIDAYFLSEELDPLINNADVINVLKKIFEGDSFLLGQQSVVNNESSFSLVRYDEHLQAIADAYLSSKAEGIAEGETMVTSNPASYSLVTQSAYNKALLDANESAEQAILDAKVLAKAEGVTIGRADGEQSVIGNPSAYNLFTSVQYEEALQSLDTNATPYTPSWFYIPDQGWMWTQKSAYPYFYDHNTNNWMYFQLGHENPRFYHYGTKEWMTLE